MNRKISVIHRALIRCSNFMHEIWRRRLVQSAAGYAVAGWIVVEIASVVLPAFDAPPVMLRAVIGLILLGFPIVMVFSWLFDLTSEGLKRTEDEEEASDQGDEEEEELGIQSVRRQLTVLHASIEIDGEGGSVDPEDLLEIQPRALQLCRKICERYEGTIVPSRAGELSAYFGYPIAHEEATRNAVRAGLGLVSGISRFSEGGSVDASVHLSCRAAVHTGDVVVEESTAGEDGEATIVGIVPSEAVRLLNRCSAGELLISGEANHNVRGLFEVNAVADPDSGGTGKEVYRVSYESGARNRLEAQREDEKLPLIGRDIELSQLQQHWRRALDGTGQVVLLGGGAGMGKSRIVQAFKEVVAENPQAWLWEMFCEPMSKDTALHPVAEFFHKSVLGLDETESPAESLAQVEGFLAEYNKHLADAVPLFAGMLNVPLSDQYAPVSFSPQRQRQAIMQLVVDILVMRATRQPSLMIMEDMQWADSTTLELLTRFIEQVPVHKIMCVLTYRPPFEPPWKPASHIFPMNVAGLDSQAAAEVCSSVSGDIPEQVVARITAKADGVPLFIEEVTKSLVESGAFGDAPDEHRLQHIVENLIPATLKDALNARLDRLGRARGVAQLGAAIGRDFDYGLIAEVAKDVKVRKLDDGLQQLVDPEILHKIGSGGHVAYRFKHALIQDAAYQSLIRKQRKLFHNAIARVLEEQFPDLVASNPEILALHCTYAEEPRKAIEYRLKAAERAMLTAATTEAISNLKEGLLLLDSIAPGQERDLFELSLQTTLGSASMFAYGYASPQAHEAYSAAERLCGPNVPMQHAIPVTMGLSAYHSVRGAISEGQRQNERILELAELSQDNDLLLWGHAFTCVGRFYEGRFEESLQHFKEVNARYDPERHKGLSAATSQDPRVFAALHAAQAMWALGLPDQARQLAIDKDRMAVQLGHPLVLQQALGWGNIVFLYRREPAVLVEKARSAHKIAEEQDIPFYIGGNLVWWGAGISEQGDHEAGIEMMREGIGILEGTGARIGRPLMLTLVAESLLALGRPEDAQGEIDEALAQVGKWGERFYLAETTRVNGDLLLAMERHADAEQAYRDAIRIAREQDAKGWELRAATSLGQLLQSRQEHAEAKKIITEVCDRFDEGQGTGDIRQAQAVLATSG